MKSNNPRIERLKEMLSLEERRESLEQELGELSEQLTALKSQISGGLSSAPAAAAAPAAVKGRASSGAATAASAKATGRRRTFGSGLLKDKVMNALTAAGAEGVHVKELAAALNTKPVNIHSWFHSNIKRNPAIKKLTGGHYRLEDASTSAASTSSKPTRKAKSQKAEVKAPTEGSRRGALKSQILSELASAGTKGITVRELADKLGTKYKNVYIWFSTTGKKGLGVEKIGKATYRLAA
ncbi:MAG: hypothetical protein JWL90_2775 [Chthoniobacteraceae bacterium]|nr:hypothetical protein [Chthoniobacteraceae bacterium]